MFMVFVKNDKINRIKSLTSTDKYSENTLDMDTVLYKAVSDSSGSKKNSLAKLTLLFAYMLSRCDARFFNAWVLKKLLEIWNDFLYFVRSNFSFFTSLS